MRPWMLAIIALTGCGTPWIEEIDGDLRRLTTTLQSNGAGNFKATIKPQVGESAMLVTITPTDPNLDCHVRTLQIGSEVPFRADIEVGSDLARTNAGFIGHSVSMNWPIAEPDGFLRPGTNHKVQVGIVDPSLVYTRGTARVSVVLKRDIDFAGGTLKVNLLFAGSTGADNDLVLATNEAIALWRNMYAAIGIDLEITQYDFLDYGVLAAPSFGDPDVYQDISGSVPFGGVNIVILESIDGGSNDFSRALGVAGGIPGPLVPSGNGAVVVSAALASGPDGRFSARETQLLAETLGHETGHFLGLFHPVEQDFASWDALPDTPDCTAELSCRQSVGTNLMYLAPICDSVSCVPQTELTPQQGAVANRYTGVL